MVKISARMVSKSGPRVAGKAGTHPNLPADGLSNAKDGAVQKADRHPPKKSLHRTRYVIFYKTFLFLIAVQASKEQNFLIDTNGLMSIDFALISV